MRTFATERNQPQKPMSTGFSRSASSAEKNAPSSLTMEPIRFAHDLSQVPTHSNGYPTLQAKLTVSSPGEPWEQEADRVADAVVRMERPGLAEAQPALGALAVGPPSSVQRQAEDEEQSSGAGEGQGAQELDLPEGEEEDGAILPKSIAPDAGSASSLDLKDLGASASKSLPSTERKFMETRFGYDFSGVRIHTDSKSAQLADSISAAAFTHGRHIFFGAGRFNQNTETGRRLLAHELTHVVQQGGGDSSAAVANIHRSLLQRPEIHSIQGKTAHRFLRSVEAHVNLHQPQKVRIYDSGGTTQDFETSAGTGTRTSRLIRRTPYHIRGKREPPTAKVGRWGLQYFAWFHGGVGFHSNICYPRPSRARTVLTVDGTPHSHGCLRLSHGNSQTVYNALSVGDDVYIYDRASFRPASWDTSGSSSSPSGSSTATRYVVAEGDTLSEIATRFGVSADAIAQENGITDIHSIRAGQELVIPAASEE